MVLPDDDKSDVRREGLRLGLRTSSEVRLTSEDMQAAQRKCKAQMPLVRLLAKGRELWHTLKLPQQLHAQIQDGRMDLHQSRIAVVSTTGILGTQLR